MRVRNAVIAAAVAATIGLGQAAEAKEFRWAFQGDAQSLDPYSLNETFTLGFLGNVYEGLTQRGPELEIMPALAESWEIVEPTRWRFQLRKGVKFHNGNEFSADDVIFSFERIQAEGSDLQTRIPGGTKIEKVDDYTVDIITDGPNPILINDWDSFYIMDKEWSEANDATAPTSVTEGKENYAAFNANGTGPFKIESRERDVRTIFVPNENYWGDVDSNVTRGIFTPISSDATRVAALLSGEIDMMYPVPVQDMKRINDNSGTSVLSGPELRTIFLGFDQERDELLSSDVKGENPFKDVRVRQAFYQAIDIEAIKAKVMRGLSTPSALMISPFLFSRSDEFERPEYDPEQAKDLLADAGYPDGFQVGMDCPNNRYVNDEAICQAVVAMLARIGVEVDLLAQPKAQYFAKVLGPKYDTSFYLLGWTPGTFDSHNVLFNLHGCRDPETGSGKFNLGGYCDPEVDELTAAILVETDTEKRDNLIKQAYDITTSEVAHIPLHQQAVAWAKKDSIDLVQRADNVFMLYHTNVK